jgi:hypothetical protein
MTPIIVQKKAHSGGTGKPLSEMPKTECGVLEDNVHRKQSKRGLLGEMARLLDAVPYLTNLEWSEENLLPC